MNPNYAGVSQPGTEVENASMHTEHFAAMVGAVSTG